MNGLDCLRAEMERRGLNKAQIESKVAAVVLDIVANSGDTYTKMWEKERNSSERLLGIENRDKEISRSIWQKERRLEEMERSMDAIRKYRKECEEYIEGFNKSLLECETKEGRDTMRIAQMFANSVDVITAYDNTAYIIGVAAILSQGGINALEELKKINKNLPAAIDPFENMIKAKGGRI